MTVEENVAKGVGLMTELNEERRQECADILLSSILEIKKEIGYVS